MRYASSIGLRGLGGADVKSPIHRHRVHRNNFSIQPFGKFEGETRLAGAGRPSQHESTLKTTRTDHGLLMAAVSRHPYHALQATRRCRTDRTRSMPVFETDFA